MVPQSISLSSLTGPKKKTPKTDKSLHFKTKGETSSVNPDYTPNIKIDNNQDWQQEVKKSNQYVKYGLYLESYARTRGWLDLLNKICPDLSLAKAKAYLYNLQFHEDVSDIIKIFSQMIYDIQFKMNDLLLSGILDTQFIENNHKNLKNTYHSNGIWNKLNEKI
ncbi:10172_t:CDS:2 [Dentiscutata erythropus]|uniref:10172_t:CDS:1 n=1 Tax=Dentiscutata erythropus TaxID=1348616 RepID=A0A9N9CK76_9GLOM|nr:10172_t:CDS:2 [Dentiscutata erythropus]